MAIRLMTTFILLAFVTAKVQAEERPATQVVGEHRGYLSSVKEERHLEVVEMILANNPPEDELSWESLIFIPKVTRELREQYTARFGRTETGTSFSTSSLYKTHKYSTGVIVTLEEDVAKKRAYGEYMFRRLTEYHVGQYFKSRPSLKPVYQLKEKISKVQIQVKKGYKIKYYYSFSGSYLDMWLDNPYKATAKLNFRKNETSLNLGYPLTNTLSVQSHYYFNSKHFSVSGHKRLKNNISTSLTGSTYINDNEKEHRMIILGLTWTQ